MLPSPGALLDAISVRCAGANHGGAVERTESTTQSISSMSDLGSVDTKATTISLAFGSSGRAQYECPSGS
jgi:hypothetical protein